MPLRKHQKPVSALAIVLRLPNIILALADAKFMNMAKDEKVAHATRAWLGYETYGPPIIVVGKPTFGRHRQLWIYSRYSQRPAGDWTAPCCV
jgi:hypothetical protein